MSPNADTSAMFTAKMMSEIFVLYIIKDLKLAFSLAAITWFGSVSASISINRKPVIRR